MSNQKENYYNLDLRICKFNKKNKNLIYNNPHCLEFFCYLHNLFNCTKCADILINDKNIKLLYKKLYTSEIKKNKKNIKYCKKNCNCGYVYDGYNQFNNIDDKELIKESKIDKYKLMTNFYNKKLIYKLEDIPYIIDYEQTFPKPKTVIHWGQLKMLLITIIFLINKVDTTDEKVHIIYPGSAPGDNILILCLMFPNTIWYLTDPNKHNYKLYNHPQIAEIKEGLFTEENAHEYYNKFKNRDFKLLFISDIRIKVDDDSVLEDQENNIKWHKIIQPDFSYFKFRCGYNSDENYKYYKGDIFLQPYAPISSIESRIILSKELEEYNYNIKEYQGKFIYFNRILRPSYYVKSIITDNNYFDHCYDCTYFSYLIQNYLNKFKNFNPFKTTNVYEIMIKITNIVSKYTINKIDKYNSYIRNNILWN